MKRLKKVRVVAVLLVLLGLLVGIAYITMMLGNVGPKDEPKLPGEESTTDDPNVVDFSLDGVSYRVSRGTTWSDFNRLLDANEDTRDVLDILYAGVVVNGTNGRYVKSDTTYVRSGMTIEDGGAYVSVVPVLCEYRYSSPGVENCVVSFTEGLTWADVLSEDYTRAVPMDGSGLPLLVLRSSSVFELSHFAAFELNGWPVSPNDFVVADAYYTLGDEESAVNSFFYCGGEQYPLVEGMTVEDYRKNVLHFPFESDYGIYSFNDSGSPIVRSDSGQYLLSTDELLRGGSYGVLEEPKMENIVVDFAGIRLNFEFEFSRGVTFANVIMNSNDRLGASALDEVFLKENSNESVFYLLSEDNRVTVDTKVLPNQEFKADLDLSSVTYFVLGDKLMYCDSGMTFRDLSEVNEKVKIYADGLVIYTNIVDLVIYGARADDVIQTKQYSMGRDFGQAFLSEDRYERFDFCLGLTWGDLLKLEADDPESGVLEWVNEPFSTYCEVDEAGRIIASGRNGETLYLGDNPVYATDYVIDDAVYLWLLIQS